MSHALNEIMQIEGITVRRIPFESVALYAYREGRELKDNQTLVTRGERRLVREVTRNSLGGKYIVTMVSGQGSTVRFDVKHDGVGDTVEAAYEDFLAKSEKRNAPAAPSGPSR